MFFNSFVPRFKLEAEGRKESAPFADVVFTRLGDDLLLVIWCSSPRWGEDVITWAEVEKKSK